MNVPKVITRLLRDRQEEHVTRVTQRKVGEVWVTELIECPMKRVFRCLLPFLETDVPVFLLGDFVHKGLQSYLKQMGYETEVDVEYRLDDNTVIKGRLDAYNGDEVVEIKYMRSMRDSKPLEHHVIQLKIYMMMVNAERGRLIYVTPDRIAEYIVENPYTPEQVKVLLEDEKIPRWEWECDYCPYKSFCSYVVSKRR
ncbi:MAG: CRISPR-associated protein Cas4 [Candidatus Methanospirareceae archaeon]